MPQRENETGTEYLHRVLRKKIREKRLNEMPLDPNLDTPQHSDGPLEKTKRK